MNMKICSLVSTLALFTTACTPKDETPDTATPSATVSSVATVIAAHTTSAAASSVTIELPTEMENPSKVELLNTYWKLIQLNNNEVAVSNNQREPHIVFNAENRVSGSDGCNSIMGSYTLEDDKLTLGQLAGTRMACMERMEQSQAFNQILAQVASYSVLGDELEFRDAGGLLIARFQAVALP